jgi:hypothetical protein
VDDVLLEDLLTFTTLLIFNDVSHTSLVADEGSEVDWLGLVILGEVSYTTSMMLRTSLWQVGQGAVSWVLKLSA